MTDRGYMPPGKTDEWRNGQCCAHVVWVTVCLKPVDGAYFCADHWLAWDAHHAHQLALPGVAA